MEFNYFKDNTIVRYNSGLEDYVREKCERYSFDEFGLDEKNNDLFEKLNSNNIVLENNTLYVNKDNATYKLKTIEYQDTPINDTIKESIRVSKESLLHAVNFIELKNRKRPVFNGVCISSSGISATDSYVLYHYATDTTLKGSYIITQNFIKNITKYNLDEYELQFNDNLVMCNIRVDDKEIFVVGKLIAGNYPDIVKVLQRPLRDSLTLNLDNFNNVVSYCNKEDTVAFEGDKELDLNTNGSVEVAYNNIAECSSPIRLLFSIDRFNKFNVIASGDITLQVDNTRIAKLEKDNETILVLGMQD